MNMFCLVADKTLTISKIVLTNILQGISRTTFTRRERHTAQGPKNTYSCLFKQRTQYSVLLICEAHIDLSVTT